MSEVERRKKKMAVTTRIKGGGVKMNGCTYLHVCKKVKNEDS